MVSKLEEFRAMSVWCEKRRNCRKRFRKFGGARKCGDTHLRNRLQPLMCVVTWKLVYAKIGWKRRWKLGIPWILRPFFVRFVGLPLLFSTGASFQLGFYQLFLFTLFLGRSAAVSHCTTVLFRVICFLPFAFLVVFFSIHFTSVQLSSSSRCRIANSSHAWFLGLQIH